MKFGQLTEYNMRKIFLEKSCAKCGGETIPRPFPKKSKIKHISGSRVWSYTVCCNCISSWVLSKYIGIKLQTTCFYLIERFSKKTRRSGTNLFASFSAWFLRNIFILLYSINLDQISLSDCLYFMRYWALCVL